jgi:hypothetical protein
VHRLRRTRASGVENVAIRELASIAGLFAPATAAVSDRLNSTFIAVGTRLMRHR